MIAFILKLLNSLKLNARINLFIIALLIIIFTSLGYYIYYTQKKELQKISDKQLRVLLEDLIDIFEVQTSLKQANVNSALEFGKHLFESGGQIIKTDSLFIQMEAINQVTKQKKRIKVPRWFYGGIPMHSNSDFVDQLKNKGIPYVSLLQKFSDGYVRISSTFLRKDSTRAVGEYIPNNSPVIQAIESGISFRGRSFVVNDWYLTAYDPIYVDGELECILEVGLSQMDYSLLQPIFYEKRYLQSGYPYVVSGDGISIINVSGIEGRDLRATNFFHLLVETRKKKEEAFRYLWPEDETGQWKWTYFKYYEPLDIYVATSIFEYELYSGLEKIRNGIIIGVIIAIIIFFFSISMIIRPITAAIQKLVEIISSMSKGKTVEKMFYPRKDEIGDIIESLNKLINGLNETAHFSNEIEKGNFTSEFTPLSNEDVFGNALLDMRRSLQKAKEEEINRKQDDEKRKWATEGLSLFNDILRKSSDDIRKLTDTVIKNIVRYLEANQGGLFILNDDDKEKPILELVSAYAYDRKRFLDKAIQLGEGLIGTSASEKETIYLTEIPEKYIEITSGLGTASPRAILIVPMRIENRVFGVIEVASFKEIEDHQIKFLERLGENIASTLASVKISTRTNILLRESQKKSEILAEQEEKMRVSLVQLQEAQDESARRQAEMSSVIAALDSSFLVAELDMDGNYQRINSAYLKLFNSTERQAIGNNESRFIQFDDENKILYTKFWSDTKAGRKTSQKILSRCLRNDQEYWLSQTYTPIFDNNDIPYKVLNIAIDITQSKNQEIEIQQLLEDSRRQARKLEKQEKLNTFNIEKLAKTQAESAKKESEISNILTAIDDAIIRNEYTTDGKVLFVNTKYLSVMGLKREEIENREVKELIPPEEMDDFIELWTAVLNGNQVEKTVRRITSNGKEVWFLALYVPVVDKKGVIQKIMFLANDITKQKVTENRMKQQAVKILEKNKQRHSDQKRLTDLQEELVNVKAESEAFNRAMSNHCIVMYDSTLKIVDMNAAALNKCNMTHTEIWTKSYDEIENLLAPQPVNDKVELLTRLKAGEVVTFSCVTDKVVNNVTDTFTPVFDAEMQLHKIIRIVC